MQRASQGEWRSLLSKVAIHRRCGSSVDCDAGSSRHKAPVRPDSAIWMTKANMNSRTGLGGAEQTVISTQWQPPRDVSDDRGFNETAPTRPFAMGLRVGWMQNAFPAASGRFPEASPMATREVESAWSNTASQLALRLGISLPRSRGPKDRCNSSTWSVWVTISLGS